MVRRDRGTSARLSPPRASHRLIFAACQQGVRFRAREVPFPPRATPEAKYPSRLIPRGKRAGTKTQLVLLDAPPERWQEIPDSLRRRSEILEITLASMGFGGRIQPQLRARPPIPWSAFGTMGRALLAQCLIGCLSSSCR